MIVNLAAGNVEVLFSEYDHTTKRAKPIDILLTKAQKEQIEMLLEENPYSFGEFMKYRRGDITVTGVYEIIPEIKKNDKLIS